LQSLTARRFDVGIDAAAVRANASHHLVLPRALRRPFRAFRRLDWRLPSHIGTKSVFALFIATAIGGLVAGGNSMTVLSAVSAKAGFAIDNVKITGQSETSETDVLAALDIGQYPSLLTLDLEDAQARIEQLPWVKTASLKKLFPDSVEISISERQPFAVWQHDGKLSLTDRDGKVITDAIDDSYASLPHVVGVGAAEKAADFTALIAPYPQIAAEVHAGILVSENRWTLVLDNGIELMLPADGAAQALATIADLDRTQSLLSREIAVVDMRQPGNLVLRLTEAGVADRDAATKKAAHPRTNT
jgi:cell division protein FtsQ